MRFLKSFLLGLALLIFIKPSSAQYHDSTYLVILHDLYSQSYIDEMLEELNSVEIWVSPISKTRLWKVVSFPYTYGNVTISNIQEQGQLVEEQRPEQESVGLDFAIDIQDADARLLNTDPDLQNDCYGNLSTFTSSGMSDVRIGVFDTGLNYHPNNDPDYYFDLDNYDEYDHLNNDNVADDENGHGTHIASVMSHSINKFSGMSNIPHENESYDIRKCFDSNGYGYLGEIILAFEEAILDGMKIANFSWTYGCATAEAIESPLLKSLQLAESEYGVLIVAAAGNSGLDLNGLSYSDNVFPASYDLPNIITATSYNCENGLARFANYGDEHIDIALPGIKLTGMNHLNDKLKHASGTSQSTALLSGIAASLATHQVTFDYEAIICAIMNSATYEPNISSLVKSEGLINAEAALLELLTGPCGYTTQGPGGSGPNHGNRQSNTIYPNPVFDFAHFEFATDEDEIIKVNVYDHLGRVSFTSKNQVFKGMTNQLSFDFNRLPAGLYRIELAGKDRYDTTMFVKK